MNFIFGSLIFVGIIAGLAFVIQKLAKAGLRKIKKKDSLKKEMDRFKNNPYILKHQVLKINNDVNYKQYLEWCGKNDQIPMDKVTFLKDIERKEKKLQNLYK